MNFRPDPKPERTGKRPRIPLGRVAIKRKRKEPTGELPLFKEIVRERGNRSEISDDPIYNITVSSMIHVLPKASNKYPKFILYKKNIIIGTPDEHYDYDFGDHEKLRKDPRWKWVFDLREELLQEYRTLYG